METIPEWFRKENDSGHFERWAIKSESGQYVDGVLSFLNLPTFGDSPRFYTKGEADQILRTAQRTDPHSVLVLVHKSEL